MYYHSTSHLIWHQSIYPGFSSSHHIYNKPGCFNSTAYTLHPILDHPAPSYKLHSFFIQPSCLTHLHSSGHLIWGQSIDSGLSSSNPIYDEPGCSSNISYTLHPSVNHPAPFNKPHSFLIQHSWRTHLYSIWR